MSTYQNFANAASDLILQRGNAQARGLANKGQILGSTIATLGDRIPKQIQEVMRVQAEKRRQAEIQGIFQKYGADWTQAIPEIMQKDPALGSKLAEQQARIEKDALEIRKLNVEHKKALLDYSDKMLSRVNDDDSYAEWLLASRDAGLDVQGAPPKYDEAFIKGKKQQLLSLADQLKTEEAKVFNLGAGGKLVDATGKVLAENPVVKGESTPSAGFTLSPGQTRYGADGKPLATAPGRPAAESNARPVAVLGPDGKTPVYVAPNQAVGRTPAPSTTARETTEDERKTAGFYTQMQQAIKIMDEVEDKLTERELYQIQTLPQEGLIGMANRNQLSENAKRYLRAFNQFTESRLRPVSGAAIADSEYARDRQTYAKQYGETSQLRTDRRNARNSALATLKTRAGRAFSGTDEADTGGEWVDGGNGLKIRKK